MNINRQSELLTRFARIIAADGYGRGMQPVQWLALIFLNAANRFSRTAKALTAWLDQTKGSVSQTIAALEKKGLIGSRLDPADRRVVRLDLTDSGQALVNAAPPPIAEQMLSSLPESHRSEFSDMLERMLLSKLTAAQGRPFGLCRACRHFEGGQNGNHRCVLLNVSLTDEDSQQIGIEQEAA